MQTENLLNSVDPVAIHGTLPREISAVYADSRRIGRGTAFIAIKGTQTDGHRFIEDAVEKGAELVFGQKSIEAIEIDVNQTAYVQLADTRKSWGFLAQKLAGHPAKKLKNIGITGTNGKTTVATLVYQLLQGAGKNASLLGTNGKIFNKQKVESHLTTADPTELAADMMKALDAGSEFLVMEVSSHALDQERTAGVSFDVAAFTNLSHDHLDYHHTFEAYANAKKKLFDSLDEDSSTIINADDDFAGLMAAESVAEIIPFSLAGKSRVIANKEAHPCQILSMADSGMRLEVDEQEIETPLIGHFNAYNVAEAYLICRALGLSHRELAKAAKTAHGAEGRLERITSGHTPEPTVVVDYAHTPDALENALNALKSVQKAGQNVIVVFGCGGDRDRKKRPEMGKIATTYANWIFVTSDNPRTEEPDAIIDEIFQGIDSKENVTRIADRREAIDQSITGADANDIILIAGKGHETYQEINGVRHDFDDREFARQALKQRSSSTQKQEMS